MKKVIFGLLLIFLFPAQLMAGPSRSLRRLQVDSPSPHQIKLSWSVGKKKKGDILEVARKSRVSGQYTTIAFIALSAKTGTLTEKGLSEGYYRYRLRKRSKKKRSRWKKTPEVYVAKATEPEDSNPAPPPPPPESTPQPDAPKLPMPELSSQLAECPSDFRDRLVASANAARSEAGVPAFSENYQLHWSARSHTIDLAESQNLSHEGWLDHIYASGFTGSTMGENIAFGYSTPETVTQAWLNSSGHRRNMLNPKFSYIGVSCVIGPSGRFWWTQNFGG